LQTILVFALLGLGSGAVIAAVAIGVVLSWRGTGSFNLAAGSSVMVAGYMFWAFRTGFFHFVLDTWPAVIATLAFMVLYAVVIELLAVRPLRTASPLAKLVASLGVLLLSQALVQVIFGTAPLASPAVLPDGVIVVGDVPVPVAQLILAAGVSLLAAGLWFIYRFTRFGLATRASSENEVSAVLAGLEPSSISVMNSILANLGAGAVGIAAAPIVGISATTIPLLIVPALAAALFARFTSFGIACAAGLAIGVGESLIFYASTQTWFPSNNGVALSGIQHLVVFVLIVVALWWRGSSLPQRGDLRERSLPRVPKQDQLARRMLPIVAACAIALVVLPPDFRQAVATGLVGTVLCLSFIVIMGYVGQLSVVQLALAGIAGFGVARVSTEFGLGFPLGPLVAIAVAVVVGVAVGISALRVRGVTLVVVTLAAAVAIEKFVFANPDWGGGQTGVTVQQPEIFGVSIGTDAGFRGLGGDLPSPVFGLCALVVTAALYSFVANLRRGELGRRMLAVRSNERAAAAAGVNVRALKISAFAISSALAGVAGVLFAYDFGTVSTSMFDVMTALSVVASVYVLGVTVVQGAVLGGFGMVGAVVPLILQKWVLPQDRVGLYVQLLIGAGLLIQLRFYPDGILIASATKRERRRAERLGGPAAQGAPALSQQGAAA
jgi:branched-chain amino acid transport system permease protein